MELPFKNFYGRVAGHMSSKSRESLTSTLPLYLVQDEFFSPKGLEDLKSKYHKLNLEIGFGGGDFLFGHALNHPNDFYLGAEVFQNGIASLLSKLEENPLDNVKIYDKNVYNLFEKFQPQMFDNIYILFPDPWPKKKHNKRRIVNLENLAVFHNILKKDGNLRFVSDCKEYVDEVLEIVLSSEYFTWDVSEIDDFKLPPEDHVQTKYERKALNKCTPISYINLKVKQ